MPHGSRAALVLRHYCSVMGIAGNIANVLGQVAQLSGSTTLGSIAPTSRLQSQLPATITASGTGFTAQTKILVNGVAVATTYVSATSVTFVVPAGAPVGLHDVRAIEAGDVTAIRAFTVVAG